MKNEIRYSDFQVQRFYQFWIGWRKRNFSFAEIRSNLHPMNLENLYYLARLIINDNSYSVYDRWTQLVALERIVYNEGLARSESGNSSTDIDSFLNIRDLFKRFQKSGIPLELWQDLIQLHFDVLNRELLNLTPFTFDDPRIKPVLDATVARIRELESKGYSIPALEIGD